MALNEFHHELFGRYGVYAATNGVSDLPSSGGQFQVGDLIMNFAPTQNAVSIWQCITASPSPTWQEWGAATQVRTVASPATISTSDGVVLISSAGSETLPAATLWPVGQPVTIKDTSGGSITITPASGTIDGLAALTLTTLQQATLTGNGTVYWRIGA